MKKIIVFFAFVISFSGFGQDFNKSISLLRNANFYFLDQLSKKTELVELINNNQVFNEIKNTRLDHINKLVNGKEFPTSQALVDAYLFTDKQIQEISHEIVSLSVKQKTVNEFIDQLKKSKKYINYNSLDNKEFVSEVVKLNFQGLNHTLKVYGLGEKPFYPNIDSVSYNKDSWYFKAATLFWAKNLHNQTDYKSSSFFEPMLDYGLHLMYMNHRDEAIRYEPLQDLYNKKAIEHVKNVDFKSYPYNALIVLGDGPENYRDPLGALGKLNLKIAVQEFKQNKAPFIIVSGGHVHPNRTQTCEAIEMKKELMQVYGIPEEAIIVEPYARHTTTNLRNATRLMIEYGFDIKQKSMIVSYELHIKSIADKKFMDRFIKELGYLPGKILRQEKGELLDFYPSELLLQINPLEPLDP
ncbi:YdcF family protein [Myroides marinus]|uniref:YdcF family protein n=1 Tax=Myroides TaxID=76831 RepID=UPI00257903E5|nr:YdcF family protein [Myroides marinus]MDM1374997.1 YdcF family protein [Myroides marinus]MDM1532269.1 YdcF family protein [Myroides marinus]MDM1539231.1 YdcF family protein [Myroides marinus]